MTRAIAASLAALAGGAFFFAIVGVFGLAAAIVALVAFVVLALLTYRRPQGGDEQP
jgi:hypothetical protein